MIEKCRSREGGFSLVEVLVATGLLAVSLVALANMFGIAMRSNLASRNVTYGTLLAQQKVEELRATRGLTPSSSTALHVNTPGFVDYIDQFGHARGGGTTPSPDAIYCRRWSIQRLTGTGGILVIQVLVTRDIAPAASTGSPPGRRLPGEARLVTVKRDGP